MSTSSQALIRTTLLATALAFAATAASASTSGNVSDTSAKPAGVVKTSDHKHTKVATSETKVEPKAPAEAAKADVKVEGTKPAVTATSPGSGTTASSTAVVPSTPVKAEAAKVEAVKK